MPQKLIVDRRRAQKMFIKEGDKEDLLIFGMEESSDRRGLFLADCLNKKMKYFNRETETISVLYSSDIDISNLLLLAADGSAFATFEVSQTGFFFDFCFHSLFDLFLKLFHSFESADFHDAKRK